jgi:hypothetical protein
MTEHAWFSFTPRERLILQKALSAYARAGRSEVAEVKSLAARIRTAAPSPAITIGVHGGQVQWALGNPFPVRVCDYDGEKEDLPNVDERGQRCRMWFEPVDTENKQV